MTLYAQRPIVEKHTKYAFYHPFTEAVGQYQALTLCRQSLTVSSFNDM